MRVPRGPWGAAATAYFSMVHGRAHLLLLLLAALCRQYSLRTQCKGDAEKAAEPDLGEIPLRPNFLQFGPFFEKSSLLDPWKT